MVQWMLQKYIMHLRRRHCIHIFYGQEAENLCISRIWNLKRAGFVSTQCVYHRLIQVIEWARERERNKEKNSDQKQIENWRINIFRYSLIPSVIWIWFKNSSKISVVFRVIFGSQQRAWFFHIVCVVLIKASTIVFLTKHHHIILFTIDDI